MVVVGARCAGSPLAIRLARAGLRVCIVDRARFPSEVPSTHLIHPNGTARLADLGVLDRVLATGAPPFNQGAFVFDDVRLEGDRALIEAFATPWLCVRRVTLDAILVDGAAEAGAEVRTETAVTGLVTEDGVVRGVRTEGGEIRAGLVVGADGPHSIVAGLAGARPYHVTPPGRFGLWGYFEQAANPPGRAALGRIGDVGFAGMSTDAGLYMAALFLPMSDLATAAADTGAAFARGTARIPDLAVALAPARRVGPLRVMARWEGYFRQATGPGWALVGDAGHFKDPTPGQGIADALRQGERLAGAIVDGLGGRSDLTEALAGYGRWRDDDAWEMYWFANLMGGPGPMMRIAVEMMRQLGRRQDGPRRFLQVLDHQVPPSKVFSEALGARSLVAAGARRPRLLPQLIAETAATTADDIRHARLRRRPVFAPPDPEGDRAGSSGQRLARAASEGS